MPTVERNSFSIMMAKCSASFRVEISPATFEAYWDQVKDCDTEHARSAFQDAMGSCTHFPPISEIMRRIYALENKQMMLDAKQRDIDEAEQKRLEYEAMLKADPATAALHKIIGEHPEYSHYQIGDEMREMRRNGLIP